MFLTGFWPIQVKRIKSATKIQKQILTPFENAIVQEDELYLRSYKKEGHGQVQLLKFQSKPFKTSSSTVIKLLAKPDAVAMKVFDKIGVRFVTNTVFDSFQVILDSCPCVGFCSHFCLHDFVQTAQ